MLAESQRKAQARASCAEARAMGGSITISFLFFETNKSLNIGINKSIYCNKKSKIVLWNIKSVAQIPLTIELLHKRYHHINIIHTYNTVVREVAISTLICATKIFQQKQKVVFIYFARAIKVTGSRIQTLI